MSEVDAKILIFLNFHSFSNNSERKAQKDRESQRGRQREVETETYRERGRET
jgi:hypothetical protein